MATIVETKENESIMLLQTHYYKASYEQIKEIYKKIIVELGHNILSENDDYSEIFSENVHLTCTAKIIQQTPKETSIDFYISSEYLFGSSKKAYKFINTVYKKIESVYELKGLGLHQ